MPYASNFIQTVVEGEFGGVTGESEIWRTSFKIPAVGTLPTKGDIDGFLADIAGTISGYISASQTFAGASAKLVSLAAAVLGTDGKYVGGGLQDTSRYTYPAPIAGSGTTVAPWSTAVCVSLKTAKPRGTSSRGRLYFPATAIQLGVDGRMTNAMRNNFITQAAGLINNLNSRAATAFGGGPLKIAVMSQLGAGSTQYATHVSVGRKIDTQERREKSLSEEHVWTPLTGAAAVLEAFDRDWRERVDD